MPIATKPCRVCGGEVECPVIEDAPPYIAAMVNSMSMVCDPCAEKAERESAELDAKLKARDAAARAVARRERSGIPEHLWSWRFASIDRPRGLERAIEAAMRWATGDLNGLILAGSVGVGKTRVAVAAANAMIDRRTVRYFSAPLLIARLGTGDFTNPLRMAALDALTSADPLVLDDLDKARPTVYAAEALFVAVDQRADGAAPLLVTTNLKLRELAELWPAPFGEAIASRLALLDGVRVEGADRRAA